MESGRGEGFDKAKPTQHRAFNGGNQREGYNAGGDMQFVKGGKRFDQADDQGEKRVKQY